MQTNRIHDLYREGGKKATKQTQVVTPTDVREALRPNPKEVGQLIKIINAGLKNRLYQSSPTNILVPIDYAAAPEVFDEAFRQYKVAGWRIKSEGMDDKTREVYRFRAIKGER